LPAGTNHVVVVNWIGADTTVTLLVEDGPVPDPEPTPGPGGEEPPGSEGTEDATVVAVIDSGISPYHWDYLASKMPQATDADPSNDLPLDTSPDQWLAGFPAASTFDSFNRMDLTLDGTNPSRTIASLDSADTAKWDAVKASSASEQNYYWFPGTKIIGGLTFGTGKIRAASSTHGMGTSSVSVGNNYGTCAECLLVFIQYGGVASGERAIEWALNQPWIDVISNSYGFSLAERDRLYSGSDTELQRTASERGQTVFFSAGNGISNTFTVPNSTLFSSQEGPDWIVTVGAVAPGNGSSYSGHGKPADIAGVGGGYPSSYSASTVTNGSNFSGTSNATPHIAGAFARALHDARHALPGPSRSQTDGVIAVQAPDAVAGEQPFACGAVRPDCELGDGALTAVELRERYFLGAVHTPTGMNVGGVGGAPVIGEDEFLNEGHGTYFGKLNGDGAYRAELASILDPMMGLAAPLVRPDGEREWMIVDSFCRQEIWGDWAQGYFLRDTTALPGQNQSWPLRSAIETVCPELFPPV
jgi:hypothetical protein